MTDLTAKTPCEGLLPQTIGTVTLSEMDIDAITSVAPFKGQEKTVSDALKSAIGAAFPAANRLNGKSGGRVVWSGMGQAMVLGATPGDIAGAALTDQSDAWTSVTLEGEGARDVLARLTPLDLRATRFKRGHAARSELAHMSAILMRTGENRYDIMVFRSMAKTLVHDLSEAMLSVAGRRALG
ncbi:sarcosine oxidase subunit gamma family protein [Alisedimentitalea sp. MJ-SS2]|uniref:sarcosine oxidase subunit gamma n=1 Tax=Aliisedimentitalea sp. MJ-SS2 TaxID=3049795 RepID=UPI00290BE091|nr:sarcosine oxidase subunit gamma family protein [Alisedimentitalea sp. MJ-SS2]MDU8929996.1 sarcosine oxidase subunit gamma family protein [Alisedimentitalea sp. MJ-SS2]